MKSSAQPEKFISSGAEDFSTHRDSGEEIRFLHNVSHGHMDEVKQNCEERRFLDSTGVGMLSKDPVLNLKYHFVVTAGLITRKCIEKGLEPERAFTMSDYYIRKLDDAVTIEDVEQIHNNMVLDFTGKMRLIRRDKGLSRSVTRCVEYIYAHIRDRITIAEHADYAKVSCSFLSRQFKKELGISVSDYIRERKIEVSKELLRDTEESILDISYALSFSSQSHFIQSFKAITGITPKKYRQMYGSNSWD